jgi:hypothetical protein
MNEIISFSIILIRIRFVMNAEDVDQAGNPLLGDCLAIH